MLIKQNISVRQCDDTNCKFSTYNQKKQNQLSKFDNVLILKANK